MPFSKTLHDLRIKKGLSQKQLAELAGVSQTAIYHWEKGIRAPKIEALNRLAEALRVDLADLLGISTDVCFDYVVPQTGIVNIDIDGTSISVNASEFQKSFNDVVQKCCPTQESELLTRFYALNLAGQDKAIEQVEMLTKIPEYRNVDAPDPEE